ncbi:hypothetical protein B0T17DRAFT_612621 [Bombardia bombarda]|uniref:Uncharacterized protein n=1 Tax=Bombardia bombarda TaxID=252184 RepID=A0AA39XKR2_9PEZI|nr:hypothetical protein B0T17DRAFT_612621 [Bombardia bombarda]
MSANVVSALRCSFRTVSRRPIRPQFTRSIGRRGYASDHGNSGKTSDLPWLVTAVAVTVPGSILIWRSGHKKPGHGSHDKTKAHEGHEEKEKAETPKKEPSTEPSDDTKDEPKDEPSENDKFEDGSSSSDDDDAPPTPSSSDGGESKEINDNKESQEGKLTDKPASKRVDPTEK